MSDPEAPGATQAFAWGHMATIILGTIAIIALICTLATVLPKGTA